MSSALAAATTGLIVRGLCKRFGSLQVTDEVDLEVLPGARLALIGPNGAGKTTLVNLLTGALSADAGTIQLQSQRVDRWQPERRVKAGLVRTHQITQLLGASTARDNVALAIAERSGHGARLLRSRAVWQRCVDEAAQYLEWMGLADVGARRVNELPYGHQRLLELSVALALEPQVLLLDEPAAGVAAADVPQIHRALERLPERLAIVLIEHDMNLVFGFAQEIAVLVRGRLLVRASPAEVRANPLVQEAYLGRSSLARSPVAHRVERDGQATS
jgi:branched-chain amino acid transport system ATP-binding protein